MNWIRHVIIDLAVTVLIVLAVAADQRWAWWIIAIYTPLMLLMKITALVGARKTTGVKVKPSGVPVWFYHTLYALNVLLLAVGRQWWLALGWLVIWLLSYLHERRS